jgi:hypothetical protein
VRSTTFAYRNSLCKEFLYAITFGKYRLCSITSLSFDNYVCIIYVSIKIYEINLISIFRQKKIKKNTLLKFTHAKYTHRNVSTDITLLNTTALLLVYCTMLLLLHFTVRHIITYYFVLHHVYMRYSFNEITLLKVLYAHNFRDWLLYSSRPDIYFPFPGPWVMKNAQIVNLT